MSIRQILHVDLDAFFASVEQLDFPSYRGKPVIVGGLPGDRRSVVSTASYEARKFGVHSAMPTAKAYQLCPQGIYVRGRMDRYCQLSRQIMAIFSRFSPDVQQMSIDEAFVDLTGTEKLFGSAESTARKIKEAVFQETGLTVSVGLASNKYLAKIASGMDKPDGLFVIPPGSEETFMRSIPLDKVWGVGGKTRKLLNERGFYTTEAIYRASLAGLTQLFGECTGLFLYRAVRGEEAAGFDEEPKSRSISNENTFSFDLTDRDIILTALLDLCYTVYFRLLSDGLCSRTVHLKIRYEDFSTVSIQETLPRYISSTDDFYERIVSLFDRKYDRTMGIRLLGVGCQNVENGVSGQQQELFDFGESKKRAVEQAVLGLQQKDPKNLVKKARQFLSCCILAAGLCMGAGHQVHASEPLYSYRIDDASVDFYTEGYWESSVTSAGNITFSPDTTPIFSSSPPVFIQNVDVTTWFMLNNQWYFEAAFADGFSENTVAAGYYGTGILSEFRIGNRGIYIPEYRAFSDSGSGTGMETGQAPGVHISLGGDQWYADALVRFEQLETYSQTWQGKNAVSSTELPVHQWLEDRFFSFSTGSVSDGSERIVQGITSVWVEDPAGSLYAADGLRYRKLSISQFLVIPGSECLILADGVVSRSGRNILVELTDSAKSLVKERWESLQNGLNDTFGSFPLSEYYDAERPSYTALKATAELAAASPDSEKQFLYIQKTGSFSPFADASHYELSSDTVPDALQLVYRATGTINHQYEVSIAPEDPHCITVIPPDDAVLARRYPFAATHPELYVAGHASLSESESYIQILHTVPQDQYTIGTAAIGETVVVRKNGIPVPAHYDTVTGNVRLETEPGPFDTITITWSEPGVTAGNPVLHGAVGYGQYSSENLSFDGGFAFYMPWLENKPYSTPDTIQQGSFLLAANLNYEKSTGTQQSLIRNTTGFVTTVSDVTGKNRIEGFDAGTTSPILLGKDSFGVPQTEQLEISAKKVMAAELTGNEKTRSGYEISLMWDTDDNTDIIIPITLFKGSNELAQAGFVSFWIRGDVSAGTQLTISTGADYAVTRDITGDITDHWKKVTIVIPEAAKRRIAENAALQLTITSGSEGSAGSVTFCGDTQGLQGITRIVTGTNTASVSAETAVPPRLMPPSFTWLTARDPLQASRFEMTVWDNASDAVMISEEKIGPLDVSQYESIEFLLMVPSDAESAEVPDVTLALLADDREALLTVTVPSETLTEHRGDWCIISHTLTAEEKARLSGNPAVYRQLTATVHPATPSPEDTQRTVILWYDELTASGTTADIAVQNHTSAEFSRQSPVFTLGTSKWLYNTRLTAVADVTAPASRQWQPSVTGSISATTSLPLFTLYGGISGTTGTGDFSPDQLTYAIDSNPDSPVTTYISVSSSYQSSERDASTRRTDAIRLSFPAPIGTLPVALSAMGTTRLQAQQNGWNQKAETETTVTIGNPAISTLSAGSTLLQNVKRPTINTWRSTLGLEFSDGIQAAEYRREALWAKLNIDSRSKSSPGITITGDHTASTGTGMRKSGITAELYTPITIGSVTVDCAFTEESVITEPYTPRSSTAEGHAYFTDAEILAENMPILWMMPLNTVPFTRNSRILQAIQQHLSETELYTCNEKARMTVSRPPVLSAADLFLPSKIELTAGRTSTVSSVDTAEHWFGEGTVTTTAFNCLGSDSARPLFTFYTQDETLGSFSVGWTGVQLTWKGVLSETLYFDSGARLSATATAAGSEKALKGLETTITYEHSAAETTGKSPATSTEQCSVSILGKDAAKISVAHSTTTSLNDNTILSWAVQANWLHTVTSETVGYSATVSGRIQY